MYISKPYSAACMKTFSDGLLSVQKITDLLYTNKNLQDLECNEYCLLFPGMSTL